MTEDFPAFLKISAAQRRSVWDLNPPKAMPTFTEPRLLSDETKAMLALKAADDRARASNRIHVMKVGLGLIVGAVKKPGQEWNQRRGRWQDPAPLPTRIEDTHGYRARVGVSPKKKKPRHKAGAPVE